MCLQKTSSLLNMRLHHRKWSRHEWAYGFWSWLGRKTNPEPERLAFSFLLTDDDARTQEKPANVDIYIPFQEAAAVSLVSTLNKFLLRVRAGGSYSSEYSPTSRPIDDSRRQIFVIFREILAWRVYKAFGTIQFHISWRFISSQDAQLVNFYLTSHAKTAISMKLIIAVSGFCVALHAQVKSSKARSCSRYATREGIDEGLPARWLSGMTAQSAMNANRFMHALCARAADEKKNRVLTHLNVKLSDSTE